MLKEVSRRRSEVAKLRKVVRNGALIKNREHKVRLMFEEKVKRLATMPVELVWRGGLVTVDRLFVGRAFAFDCAMS